MLSRDEFLEHLWDEVISTGDGVFIDNLLGCDTDREPKVVAEATAALKKMLAREVSRADICSLARWASYEAVFGVLYALDNPGVEDTQSLYEDLLSFAPDEF